MSAHCGAILAPSTRQTLARLPPERTRLQSMQQDQALRQALAIVSSTRRSAKPLGANRGAHVSPAWPCFARK